MTKRQRNSDKFTPETINAKNNIRALRRTSGYSVDEGAALLGVGRKKLEDIEAIRDYGCYLSLDLLVKVSKVYNVYLDDIVSNKDSFFNYLSDKN